MAVAVGALIALVLIGGQFGLGGEASATSEPKYEILSAKEAKELLLRLPYQYELRARVRLPKGASGAIAGRVTGAHDTSFDFGVSLGRHAKGVPVPKAGTSNSTWSERLGVNFTDNILIKGKNGNWILNPDIKTQAQSDEADRMHTKMLDALCKGITGKVCPV